MKHWNPEWLTGRGVESIDEHGQDVGAGPDARAGKPKYGNEKTTVDGIVFDSAKEAKRYGILKILQKGGVITELELQPMYLIVLNGMKVCKVIPDFRYRDANGELVVEDVKSEITRKNPLYRLKKKLLKAAHGIEVREI